MSVAGSKQAIIDSLAGFSAAPLADAAEAFFKSLGYHSTRRIPADGNTPEVFASAWASTNPLKPEQALLSEWQAVELLFQMTDEDVKRCSDGQLQIFDSSREYYGAEIHSFLFAAISLKQPSYTRTQLAGITRAINKVFQMPVILLFQHGDTLTLAVINRRTHKRDQSRDVLEKVTLIKDIRTATPHRAHIEILHDLSFGELHRRHAFTNFVHLQDAWRKTLDISELNKRFYRELSDWYYWALGRATFPMPPETKDPEEYRAQSVIRLITRLIFVWFLREMGLVPDTLFRPQELQRILEDFSRTEASTSYYQAVLQNLFFATLNQKQSERRFITKKAHHGRNPEHGVKTLFRYADLFAVPEHEVLSIFADIPFLNGGLFDCLDKENGDKKVANVDGFTETISNRAAVPDYLFFSDRRDVDLNLAYGTKNKSYKAKGIVNILEAYKFTVAENTPVEEEVALDPELLGMVFENLLASYNPETQTTARKQTGSFYTPREIVEYMVDESLKAYLREKLVDLSSMSKDDASAGLDLLFQYNEARDLFDSSQVRVLIDAIDSCKVLDPACGSGAFPMGVLHKLTLILGKLDPGNVEWRERQVKRATAQTEEAFKLGDKAEREARLRAINEVFDLNTSDYGRKLYLIENCIFGIDIQPIAVQIAKLRFFVSLVIDQEKHPGRDNLGIRSLPNLETRFVAANSLIDLPKPQGLDMAAPQIETLKQQLRDVRHKHFSASKRREKLECQSKDRELREQLAKALEQLMREEVSARIAGSAEMSEIRYYSALIEKHGAKAEYARAVRDREIKLQKVQADHTSDTERTARMLADWDPYDQNKAAAFFDAEWMFGLASGFDVVLANPPYVRQERIKDMKPALQTVYGDLFDGTADLCVFFYYRALQLLRPSGMLAFISSDKWFRADYGEKLRAHMAQKCAIKGITDFGDLPVFNATAYPMILVAQEGSDAANSTVFTRATSLDPPYPDIRAVIAEHGHSLPPSAFAGSNWTLADSATADMLRRMEKSGLPLGEYGKARVYRGILTGLNSAFYIDGAKREELIAEDPRSADIIRPLALGRDIKRWCVRFRPQWQIFTPIGVPISQYPAVLRHLTQWQAALEGRWDKGQNWWELRACDFYEAFDEPKIVYPQIMLTPNFAYDDTGALTNQKCFIMTNVDHYVLGILNSQSVWRFIQARSPGLRGGYVEPRKDLILSVPIPDASDSQRAAVAALAQKCLDAKGVGCAAWEKEIDERVAGLYGL